jgi:hypothetical protein
MVRFDTRSGRLTFLELLSKESRNFTLAQEVVKIFARVHGVSHEHRCRQVIARYLRVLNLTSCGIEESIMEDYGSTILPIIQKSHRAIRSDRDWNFQK